MQPTDPLYSTLGKAFYQLLVDEFGSDPDGKMFFNADTFNVRDHTRGCGIVGYVASCRIDALWDGAL